MYKSPVVSFVVKVDAEDQFRQALHTLGYGMPRV
jgi:hypothetical protein